VAARDDDAPKSLPQVASELWELAVAYAKQETIDPLRGLGRFLKYGVSGVIALGLGMVLLVLAGLRALQTETDATFTGSLSWLPYVIVTGIVGLLSVLVVRAIVKRKGSAL
jgi:hypothetical protein